MPDFALELAAVNELASLTGFNIKNVRPGPDKRGIDVLFEIEGRRAGAQHTTFHWDEGDRADMRGSPARGTEGKLFRSGSPYGMPVKADYRPALRRRIDEKIEKAAAHDNRDLVCETWVVISASSGRPGANAATLILPHVLRADDLNALCHAQLAASQFECACLVLHMNRVVWGWDRPGGWRVLADPDAAARQEHKERMSDLIFNQIPTHFRGACRRSEKSLAAMSHNVNWIDRATGETKTHVVRGVPDTERHAMIFACKVIKSPTRPLDVWVADANGWRIADWKMISDFGNANGYV